MKVTRKIKRTISVMMMAAVIMSLFSGCYFLPEEEAILAPPLKEPEEVTYKTQEVTTGTIERWIKGTGSVVSTARTDVCFMTTSGRLKELYVKSGDMIAEGDIIAELDTGTLNESIEDQTIAVEKAQINLDIAKAGGDNNTIKLRRLDLKQAQIKLDRLNAQYEASVLRAPMSGVLTYVKNLSEGASIGKYDVVASIADMSKLQVKFKNDNVDELELGMEIDLKVNNIESLNLVGVVVQTPNNLPDDAAEALEDTVMIEITNLPPDAEEGDSRYTFQVGSKKVEVAHGDDVHISVLLERKEDVIVLPMSRINRYATRRYVRVLSDGVPEERDVQIGIDNGSQAEIVGGLEVGDLIIV